MDYQSQITELQERVSMLEAWKMIKERQQLSYPLDLDSLRVLRKYFLSNLGVFLTGGGAAGTPFANILIQQENNVFPVSISSKMIIGVPDSVGDTYTLLTDLVTGAQGVLTNDMFVTILAPDPGDVPTGLINGSGYFIVNHSGNTVQLSLTKGGAAVNFTTNGSGTQYILA